MKNNKYIMFASSVTLLVTILAVYSRVKCMGDVYVCQTALISFSTLFDVVKDRCPSGPVVKATTHRPIGPLVSNKCVRLAVGVKSPL